MIIKKLNHLLLGCLSLTLLASWALPTTVSRQQVPPLYDTETIQAARAEIENENKKKKKKSHKITLDDLRFAHLARQKNKLTYFADRDGYIWFYDKENKHTYFLGNFYPAAVRAWNVKFACSEAAFQAAKFNHKPNLFARFAHLNGEEAWKLAKRHSYEQRADWYQVRDGIMLEVLRAKFNQHPDLLQLLLATGDAYLVEHTDRDAYWADGGDGKGKNRLGQLLMRVRGEKGGVGEVSKPSKYRKFARD